MEKLSKVEALKAERNPLEVINDIYEEAKGGEKITPEHIDLLKWYGMYPHANKTENEPAYFMKRIKLVDSSMNMEQLRVMSEIAKTYAQDFTDFTVRQNVQFHYIQIKDLPAIFELLDSVGLTSRLASGDGPRPIVTCPVNGIDSNNLYDLKPLIRDIDTYFDTHSDAFSNLPRKYKLGLSACSCHCMGHEIQDLAFTAVKKNNEVLFDLTIGGGLGSSKQIATRAKRYVKDSQIKDVAIAVGEIFRDNGNRQNRGKARIRHLLNDWSIEKFVQTIEEKIGYALQEAKEEPEITPYENRSHFGIHSSTTAGESYIGCATNRGRIKDLSALYAVLKKYDASGMVLTTTQNFIVTGVKDSVVQNLADELKALGYNYAPSVFEARTQSCTGMTFCKFAITETKDFASHLIAHLEEKFPEFNESFSIAVSGCPNSCSHPQIADIGLVGGKTKVDDQRVEAYDIYYGGTLHGTKESRFAKKMKIKLPVEQIPTYLENVIKEYLSQKANYNHIREYLLEQSNTINEENEE